MRATLLIPSMRRQLTVCASLVLRYLSQGLRDPPQKELPHMWVLGLYTHAVLVDLRDWGSQEKDLHSLDLRLQSVRLAAHTSLDATRVISAARQLSAKTKER